MEDNFGIVKYNPGHINVLVNPHLSPLIEPGSLSPEAILERTSLRSPFDLLQEWKDTLTFENEKIELFPIPEFIQWEDIPASMKMARLASLLGLHISSRYGQLTPEMINRNLGIYESNTVELRLKDFTEEVVNDWNEVFAAKQNDRPMPKEFIDRCVFLPQTRIQELNVKKPFCMVTPEGEALIAFDTTHAPLETNSFYGAVAHELTHLARQNRLDNTYVRGKSLEVRDWRIARLHDNSDWITEGIAQIAANRLAIEFNHQSEQNNRRYPMEVFAMSILQKTLNLSDQEIVVMPASKLIRLINDAYEHDPEFETAFNEISIHVKLLTTIYSRRNYNAAYLGDEMEKFRERWDPEYSRPTYPDNTFQVTNGEEGVDGEIFDGDEVVTGDE